MPPARHKRRRHAARQEGERALPQLQSHIHARTSTRECTHSNQSVTVSSARSYRFSSSWRMRAGRAPRLHHLVALNATPDLAAPCIASATLVLCHARRHGRSAAGPCCSRRCIRRVCGTGEENQIGITKATSTCCCYNSWRLACMCVAGVRFPSGERPSAGPS